MICVKMEKNENGDLDLVLEDGKFQMAQDAEACRVQIDERLLLERVECVGRPKIINARKQPEAGTRWYGWILDTSLDVGARQLEVKRVIFSVPGVVSIPEWQWDEVSRALNLTARIQTAYGDISLAEEFGL